VRSEHILGVKKYVFSGEKRRDSELKKRDKKERISAVIFADKKVI